MKSPVTTESARLRDCAKQAQRDCAAQLVQVAALGVGLALQVPTVILMPLAAVFGFRLRAWCADKERDMERASLVAALRAQRSRVIELENKLASARGL